MPNHVDISCTVTGPRADVQRFYKESFVSETASAPGSPVAEWFDFNTVVPMPQLMLKSGGWYSWSIKKWGTKWNAYRCMLRGSVFDAPGASGALEFSFCTAWSFPEPVFRALAEKYPTLRFECACWEEMMQFAGKGSFGPGAGKQDFVLYDTRP